MRIVRIRGLVLLCLLLLLFLASNPVRAAPLSPVYWNDDGDFSLSSSNGGLYLHQYWYQYESRGWGPRIWNISAATWSPNGCTAGSIQELIFNVSSGTAHAWGRDDNSVDWTTCQHIGVVGYDQGNMSGRPPLNAFNKPVILAYRLMRENTANNGGLYDEVGTLFDLKVISDLSKTNPVSSPVWWSAVIDFYLYASCGAWNSFCSVINDTTNNRNSFFVGNSYSWRIQNDIPQGQWVSDVVDLSWYIKNSVQRQYCYWNTKPHTQQCSLSPSATYITEFSTVAELFWGHSGFAQNYAYLLTPNDFGSGVDAGKSFATATPFNPFTGSPPVPSTTQFSGWLGSGSNYHDDDDYYTFYVDPSIISATDILSIYDTHGATMELYAPGTPPVLKASVDGVSNSRLTYSFASSDPSGNWYLHLHRNSGNPFVAYTLNFQLSNPPPPPGGGCYYNGHYWVCITAALPLLQKIGIVSSSEGSILAFVLISGVVAAPIAFRWVRRKPHSLRQ